MAEGPLWGLFDAAKGPQRTTELIDWGGSLEFQPGCHHQNQYGPEISTGLHAAPCSGEDVLKSFHFIPPTRYKHARDQKLTLHWYVIP